MAALAEGVVSVLLFMPVPLAYFSPLVGGLPGAARLGMEPTYYWDGLDGGGARLASRQHGPRPDHPVRDVSHVLALPSPDRRTSAPAGPVDPGRPAWYVLQNRPGAWLPIDRELVEQSRPAFQVEKLGVPLSGSSLTQTWRKGG